MSESEALNTAELFKGNPYLELFGDYVDRAVHGIGSNNLQIDSIIKMAELYEQRTANLMQFDDGSGLNSKQKTLIKGRLGGAEPVSDRPRKIR